MNEIRVKDIERETGAKLVCGDENFALGKIKKDTREIEDGDTYVGIKGEKFDGSSFFEEAIKNGATTCILQNIDADFSKYADKNILIVPDTVIALQQIAKYKRSMYNIPVVGVTGSVGKTSTKDMIASVLGMQYKTLKTIGNYNNHIGVPLTVLGLEDHESAVIEMGMNHLGEIRTITKVARPTICVITNVGTAHIGNLGSRENILKAKLEILEGMDENGIIVINNDNDMLHNWYLQNKEKKNIITYGIEEASDVMAKNIVNYENMSEFDVEINKNTYRVQVNVGGNHFILNALCAMCVGLKCNVSLEKILEGIKNFELTKNRMEIIEGISGAKIINDSYNASYDSMKASLENLGRMNATRRIAVLGDMLELGEYAKDLHEKVGEEVYKNRIDILITVGENARYISENAKRFGMHKEKVFSYNTNDEAIKKLKEILRNGNCVLIKASYGMKFGQIVESLRR